MINGNSNQQEETGTTTFTINADNTIIAFPSADDADKSIGEGAQPFSAQAQLQKLTAKWTISRFVETWNATAGAVLFDNLRTVRKFEKRAKAVLRIWQAAQRLVPVAHQGAQDAPGVATRGRGDHAQPKAGSARKGGNTAPKAAKASKSATAKNKAGVPVGRDGSKKAIVIGILAKGATMAELMAATEWQAHSVANSSALPRKSRGSRWNRRASRPVRGSTESRNRVLVSFRLACVRRERDRICTRFIRISTD